ncbi:alpha-glucosidase [Halovulum dunhuangense]|uniref:Alpha-glucosidase n=1 Tax=Halovulum dunhuangense TaxID=1505036 RepID=A0A849L4G3_9RHOB|nr:alpha-glucosidase [Halovulum dunhuangense]NNU81318.1 alpha-glucosidase [Halovulum dunhuangense]
MTHDPPPWWQRATGYQIYPRSFCDSNGDGIGDIPGILSRLDHLAELGIGFVWLSPVYRSPMADNGYDISDYRDVAPEFGTLADLDRLIAAARERDIGIVMDLVVNHTSDRHAWFEAARSARDHRLRDFYIWRDPAPDGGPPDTRQSYFGGPAWEWDAGSGQYYFHLFAKEQPDLNWRNPELRAAIHDMMRWWLDRGIAGFRMDVIDLIGKDVDAGLIEEGPFLHHYLQEMHRAVLAGRDVLSVGESWNATTDTALLYSGRTRGELSMIFQFEQVTRFWDPALGKWKPRRMDLPALKEVFFRWQAALAQDGWNALFWGNHDLPRAVSRHGCDGVHRVASAKTLATVLHTMRGTPFVYQGDEIGMTNARFTRIEQFRDVETLNHHALEVARGMDPAAFIAGANANGRDNGRTPMQWTAGKNAGFTSGTPWIGVNPNHAEINVADQARDEGSVLAHHRRLIALRKSHPVLVEGSFTPHLAEHPQIWAQERRLEGVRLVVLANFGCTDCALDLPPTLAIEGRCLLATHGARAALSGRVTLAPWESVVILSGA